MAGKGSEIKIKKEYVILLVILLLGAFVRFDGILREQPVQYHPDTWVIVGNAEKFANFDFTYNRPYSWPAATLIHFYGIMFLFTKMFFPLTEYFAIRAVQIGNALIGTLSILMVFIVGRKMFNTRTALIASLLFSVMMDHMILSRYETANSWAMFLMLLALYFMYKFGFDRKEQTDAQQDSSFKVSGSGLKINKDLLILGLIFGLGFATQYNTLIMAIPLLIILCYKYDIFNMIKRGRIGIAPLKRLMMSGLVIAVIAMIVFTIVAPNLTFSMTKWVSGVIYDSQRRSGFAGLEATNGMSLMGKEARIFSNLSWGFGYPLMIASVLSLLYMCYRRKKEDLLIAPFIVVYFAFMATYPVFVVWYGTFMFPFLAIAIGSLFDSSLSALTERWQRMLVYAVLILIFIYSLLYTLAFMNIMAGEDVRVTAGNWMDQNLPPGTQINFGPGINPWMMPVVDLSKYNISSTPEYIIISKAAYYNIVRLIENPSIYQPSDWAGKMPSQQEMMFYDMIYHEKGPYKLAEDVKKTPEFMGFKINDDNAPYTVWAITHPEIRIYKLQASGANETG